MKNIALIAIAKDEAPYLHEWIHHHLYLGFGKIIIGVNRTTDSSNQILNKITSNNKEVHFENLDWIDKGTKDDFKGFQPLAYAYLSSKLKSHETSHVCFLDIDEFWFSNEGNNISSFIECFPHFDIASFPWFAQKGEEQNFSEPFKNVKMKINQNVKSLIKLEALDKCQLIRPHVPSYLFSDYEKLVHLDQNGHKISSERKGNYNSQLLNIHTLNYCKNGVLHRMLRSEEEYCSLVLRGNPNGKIIKNNGRNGFVSETESLKNPFNNKYYISLNDFILKNDIKNDISKARVEKLSFYKARIDSMSTDELIGEYQSAFQALKGTNGLIYFVDVFEKKITDPNSLRNFAIILEKTQMLLALKLMMCAHKYRPKGPFIIKKIQEYKQKLQLN